MDKQYTVGKYLVDRLAELGLAHLFSIAGDYTIDWISNYVEPSSVQVIEEVNELNAGYAADGYARLKGIGALCVTYSAGSLSATNPIAGAYVEKVPVVLINGAPSIKRTLTFEQTGVSAHHFISGRQTDLQVFEYITVAAVRLDNPHLAPMLIDYALTQCITERRPVYIELLQDMVELECIPPTQKLKRATTISDHRNLGQSIDQIKKKLEGARNPLIWAGVEIDRLRLHEKAKALIQRLNIPYVTQLMSKAVLSESDPLFAGVFDGQASTASVQALAKEADFILALGVWLTDINSLGRDQDFNKTAYVSWDTVKDGTFFQPQVALEHLIDGLSSTVTPREAPASAPAPSGKVADVKLTDTITYQGFYDFVGQFIDEKTIIGSDASMNYFGSLLLRVGAARGYIVQSSYSSIGYIGPAATGVSLAKEKDQRVMFFSGDGGFQMSLQCLSTQTRFGLDPIIFVMNNGVYGVEQWLADATVFGSGKDFYKSCIIQPWKYAKLADVFGCKGWTATTYCELNGAILAAKANLTSPSIIEVVIPSKSIPKNAEWKMPIDALPARTPAFDLSGPAM